MTYLYRGLLPVACILGFAVAWYFVRSLFVIDTVMLAGSNGFLPNIDMLRGKNLLFVREKDIAEYLVKSNFNLDSVIAYKILPSTFVLKTKYRTPVGQILQNNQVYLVDASGVVFESHSNLIPGVTTIEVQVESIRVGSKFEDAYSNAVFKSLSELVNAGIPIKSVLIKNREEIIFTSNDGIIVSSVSIDSHKLASSLQVLLQGLRIEGKKQSIIDVRFDKPVIRF